MSHSPQDDQQKTVATSDKKGLLKTLGIASLIVLKEKLMAKDPVKLANQFEKNLKDGKDKVLSAEESKKALNDFEDRFKQLGAKLDAALKNK